MDRLDELLVFTAILDAGSLAAAARRLRRSPPSITRALAALEERVGARLFQRTSRQLNLTPAGRRIASHARQLLGDYEQAVGMAKEDLEAPLQGVLRVTAPSLFGRWHIMPLILAPRAGHDCIRCGSRAGIASTRSARLLYPQIAAEIVAPQDFLPRARSSREQLQQHQ